MSYTAAALLGVAGALAVDLALLRTRLVRGLAFWATYPIILFFQVLSNGVLTGRGIVRYDPDAIIGVRLAYAPVEDLLFGFALVLVTLSVWVWLGRRGVQPTPAAGQGSRLLCRLRRAGVAERATERRHPTPAAGDRDREVIPSGGSPLPPGR
ncbi:MAG TPA: lycopene cyclase domain-containing protein [Micromonospora sp.]|mgnify:CR=1 FL=1